MPVPYTFGSATSAIPLSQLDANFATTITLGNTAIQLGNTVTTLNNMTLANVTISSGSVTITSATVTSANVTSTLTLSGLTASTALALDASKNVVSVTNTGTGNNVLATSPTLVTPVLGTPTSGTLTNCTGYPTSALSGNINLATQVTGTLGTTNGGTGLTSFTSGGAVYATSTSALTTGTLPTTAGGTGLSSFTANGVVYASSSSALTTGSGLTFDGNGALGVTSGSNVSLSLTSTGGYSQLVLSGGSSANYITSDDPLSFYLAGSEQMRLTSTGLGIGTSSPSYRLSAQAASANTSVANFSGANPNRGLTIKTYQSNGGDDCGVEFNAANNASGYGAFRFVAASTTFATIDYLGNVGIGTSSPANKLHVYGGALTVNDEATYAARFGNNSTKGVVIGYDTANNVGHIGSVSPAVAWTDLVLNKNGGNLGLGVTPSAWGASWKGFEVGALGSSIFSQTAGNNTYITANAFFNGTNWIRPYAAAATNYNQNGGAHSWSIAGSGTAGSTISFTQAMTLDASGNLGVGTTSPSSYQLGGKFVVAGSTSGFYFSDANNRVILDGAGTNRDLTFYFRYSNSANIASDSNLIFQTGSSPAERARITSGGDLLVGTTDSSPIGNGVKGIVLNGTDARFDINRNGATPVFVGRFTSSGTLIDFYYAGVSKGSISTDGTNVAYNTSSDYRLKDNPQPLTGSGAFIDALKPKTWNWKTDGSKGVGFIAHEVQEVSPGSVVGTKDAVDEEGKPIMQAMEYGSAEFIANIIAELQSLRARVAQLEAK